MSDVYFTSMHSDEHSKSIPKKIAKLFTAAGFEDLLMEKDLVAIKIHFGERGNTGFIRPILVRPIVRRIKRTGAKPFLTDTNTLYAGSRSNSVDHLNVAQLHGFLPAVVDAPVIIADGLGGKDYFGVKINGKHFNEVNIASYIYNAEAVICVSHFKGHLASGFGGALKNLGMGCGSRSGKLQMHSDVKPEVNIDKCIGCGKCIPWCPTDAIKLQDKKAHIDRDACIGCGECTVTCKNGAIAISWDSDEINVQEKIVEYAYGVAKDKPEKIGFFNFLVSISPDCDCAGWTDEYLTPDIGILASKDPVAIDQASVDLVLKSVGIKGSRLKKNIGVGDDKFREVNDLDWSAQLRYAEEIGLGSRDYELKKI